MQPFEKGLVHIVLGPVGQDQDPVHGGAPGHPQGGADGPLRSHRQREGMNLHICLSPRQGKTSFFYRERVYPFFLHKLKQLIFRRGDLPNITLDN